MEYEKNRLYVQDAGSINQSKLVSLAVQDCIDEHGLTVDPEEIAALVPPSDGRDVSKCEPEELKVWAACLALRAVRYRGVIPDSWNKVSTCNRCGPVWSDHGLDMLSCGWCDMRESGKWFPRP